MPVADLAREMARRYVDTMPIADWAQAMLEPLGVPPAARTPAYDELVIVWRRVLEAALVEHYTIPELGALARHAGGRRDLAQARSVPNGDHASARG